MTTTLGLFGSDSSKTAINSGGQPAQRTLVDDILLSIRENKPAAFAMVKVLGQIGKYHGLLMDLLLTHSVEPQNENEDEDDPEVIRPEKHDKKLQVAVLKALGMMKYFDFYFVDEVC